MYPGANGRAIESGQASCARTALAPPSLTAVDKDSESQIRNALCFTEELAAQLHGEINALEHRLETGLTPLPPAPAGTNGCGPDSICRSHVLERVANTNHTLAGAIARLRELRTRVEL